jgi:integrase/recombinase XerD
MSNLASWDSEPQKAFKEFVRTTAFAKTGRRLRADGTLRVVSETSAKTYVFMFGNFATWMGEQGKTLSTLNRGDLMRFINRTGDGHRILNSKIGYRYLRLLERCYEHLNIVPNPAQQAILATDRTNLPKDAAGRALSPEQLRRFLAALPADPPRLRPMAEFSGWKRRRDRAMQVVIALAGLRVSEAIGLLVSEVGHQVALDGSIEVNITPAEKHDTSHEHIAHLPCEGVAELLPWLQERVRLASDANIMLPGDFVFPANLLGRKMIKKTVYMQIRATFERAGIDATRAGGRTLRNTFAKGQLEGGALPVDLKDVLGLALERSAADYKFARIKDDPKQ